MILYKAIRILLIDTAIETVFQGVSKNFAVGPVQYACPECGREILNKMFNTKPYFILSCRNSGCNFGFISFCSDISSDDAFAHVLKAHKGYLEQVRMYKAIPGIRINNREVQEDWDARGNRV